MKPTRHEWNAEATAIRRLHLVIQDVWTAHPNELIGEVSALVKDRLASLRISWTPAQLHAALTPFVHAMPPLPRRVPKPRVNEMALQQDPPWGPYDRGPSRWTSLADLGRALLSKRRSARSDPP